MSEQELCEIRKHITILIDLYGDASENMAAISVQLVLLLLFLFFLVIHLFGIVYSLHYPFLF